MAKVRLEVEVDAKKVVALLKALPHEERMKFVELLLKEPELEDVVEEIEDALDVERRHGEPSRPFEEGVTKRALWRREGGGAAQNVSA